MENSRFARISFGWLIYVCWVGLLVVLGSEIQVSPATVPGQFDWQQNSVDIFLVEACQRIAGAKNVSDALSEVQQIWSEKRCKDIFSSLESFLRALHGYVIERLSHEKNSALDRDRLQLIAWRIPQLMHKNSESSDWGWALKEFFKNLLGVLCGGLVAWELKDRGAEQWGTSFLCVGCSSLLSAVVVYRYLHKRLQDAEHWYPQQCKNS